MVVISVFVVEKAVAVWLVTFCTVEMGCFGRVSGLGWDSFEAGTWVGNLGASFLGEGWF